MEPPQHPVQILQEGVETWNKWRTTEGGATPDLRGGDFSGYDLSGANLRGADLEEAELDRTDLREANLRGANLRDALLEAADLRGADLRGTDAKSIYSHAANFNGASLKYANLQWADLIGANLKGADFSGANLSWANLTGADLSGTNFTGASLFKTNFSETYLFRTSLANVDLSATQGLESVKHQGPSTIGIDTLYRSKGQIPDEFLRQAGAGDELVKVAQSIRKNLPLQWPCWFISYPAEDEEFARRLQARMTEAAMRVWLAPEDATTEKPRDEQLFEAIASEGRLILIISEHNMNRASSVSRMRKMLELDQRQEWERFQRFFPVHLVGPEALRAWVFLDADTGNDLAVELKGYSTVDFSRWKNNDSFETAFLGLQNDLNAIVFLSRPWKQPKRSKP